MVSKWWKSGFLLVIIFLVALSPTQVVAQNQGVERIAWKKIKVLVYTRNGKGYVHENIPFAVKCLQRLSLQYGFGLDVADSAYVFTRDNLKQYSLLIFPSTNNDVFDTDEQRLAFRHYIEAGGGFVGLHSVIGTERNWPWFKMLLGGSFAWHPKFQKYKIQMIDVEHPSMKGLPVVWEREDECYFQKEMYPGIRTLMAHDLRTLNEAEKEKITASAGPFSPLYPACWYQPFDGGTVWITALGHDKKDYEEPVYIQHIFQGIKFVSSRAGKLNFDKAYALSKDEPLRINQ